MTKYLLDNLFYNQAQVIIQPVEYYQKDILMLIDSIDTNIDIPILYAVAILNANLNLVTYKCFKTKHLKCDRHLTDVI